MRGRLFTVLAALWIVCSVADSARAAEEVPHEKPAAESEEKPAEGPLRRRLESRLLGATPEERARLAEERKRLSETAAAFGTDPTAIIGYYQLGYGHNAFTSNLRTETVTAVVQVPITPNWFVRATMPYVWADPNQPRGSTTNGTSDTTVRMAGRLYASENVALLIGADVIFPTAAKTQLGFGKYALGPGGGLAVPLPRARSLFFLVVQDFNSVGGDPSRANVHFMQIQPAINTFWSKHWWTTVQGTWYMNWNENRRTALNLVGEVGHNFDGHWNVFAGGGVGVAGRDLPFFGLDYTVQAGVRWVFRTPLLPETFFGGPLGPDAPR